jgi:F-type H+-transporting ATPase subunit delta
VRQSIGGYFDAVVDEARINNQLERMASELRSVQELIDGHDELKAVLTDPGVSVATRRAVVTDLLQTRLSGDALRAILFAIGADPATELHDDLAWMASRADAMAGRQATPRPIEAIVLGRDAAKERLVGYTVATLEPHDDATIRRVEEELFSFMQIVDASAELRDALSNRDLTPAARHSLVTELLEGRATPATVSLATYATRVGRPRDYQELLAHLVEVVGQEADRRVAEVHVPVELDTGDRADNGGEARLGRLGAGWLCRHHG